MKKRQRCQLRCFRVQGVQPLARFQKSPPGGLFGFWRCGRPKAQLARGSRGFPLQCLQRCLYGCTACKRLHFPCFIHASSKPQEGSLCAVVRLYGCASSRASWGFLWASRPAAAGAGSVFCSLLRVCWCFGCCCLGNLFPVALFCGAHLIAVLSRPFSAVLSAGFNRCFCHRFAVLSVVFCSSFGWFVSLFPIQEYTTKSSIVQELEKDL